MASDSNPSYRLCELALVAEGNMRVAPLLGLPRLLARRGLDADAVIRQAGCDPALFGRPENTMPVPQMGGLLAHVAGVTGCPHLDHELVCDMGLSVLGMVGQLARLAPDVGAALRALILHLHLHNRGAVPTLWEGASQATFGYTIHCPDSSGTEYIYDGALAIMHNLLTELAGPGWNAPEVRLSRDEPSDVAPYRRHFRARLRFGAEKAAIVFPSPPIWPARSRARTPLPMPGCAGTWRGWTG